MVTKRSSAWKSLERTVASQLVGHRIGRGADFSNSFPDVVAPAAGVLAKAEGTIVVECKYSQTNPWVRIIRDYYDELGSQPLFIRDPTTSHILVFTELIDIVRFSGPVSKYLQFYNTIKKIIPYYILQNLSQAFQYANDLTDSVLRMRLEALCGFQIKLPILPIVCVGERGKSFRPCYTTIEALINFHQYNDSSRGNI